MKFSRILLALIVLIGVSACQNDANNSNNSKESDESKLKTEDVIQKFSEKSNHSLNSLKKFDSEEALKKEFGTQVVSQVEWREEGTIEVAISYIKLERSAQVKIVWKDKETLSGIQEIVLTGNESKFKTSTGITLGMSLQELEKLNESSFQFYGFAWDGHGTVVFGKGKLKSAQEKIILNYPMGELPKEYHSLIGDRLIPSSEPLAQKLNPIVSEIIIK